MPFEVSHESGRKLPNCVRAAIIRSPHARDELPEIEFNLNIAKPKRDGLSALNRRIEAHLICGLYGLFLYSVRKPASNLYLFHRAIGANQHSHEDDSLDLVLAR